MEGDALKQKAFNKGDSSPRASSADCQAPMCGGGGGAGLAKHFRGRYEKIIRAVGQEAIDGYTSRKRQEGEGWEGRGWPDVTRPEGRQRLSPARPLHLLP